MLDPLCPLNVSLSSVLPGPRGPLQGGRTEEAGNLSRQNRKGTVWECIKNIKEIAYKQDLRFLKCYFHQ